MPEWASNASALAASFRPKDIEDSMVARSHKAALVDLDLPEKFRKLGPAAKIRPIAQLKTPVVGLNRFLNTGAQLNTIRQVQDSLMSVAAGIQRWASFCDLINCPYFPPLTINVLKWSALFNQGRTFSL